MSTIQRPPTQRGPNSGTCNTIQRITAVDPAPRAMKRARLYTRNPSLEFRSLSRREVPICSTTRGGSTNSREYWPGVKTPGLLRITRFYLRTAKTRSGEKEFHSNIHRSLHTPSAPWRRISIGIPVVVARLGEFGALDRRRHFPLMDWKRRCPLSSSSTGIRIYPAPSRAMNWSSGKRYPWLRSLRIGALGV